MNKRTNAFTPLLILLALTLALPGGIALAGADHGALLQDVTPTAFPLAATGTPQPPSPADAFFDARIPGMLQLDSAPVRIPETTELFSFEDFGLEEMTLRGPFAANGYYFDLPATWKNKTGATLRFTLDVFYTGGSSGQQTPAPAVAYGGNLLVQYNYITIGAIDLGQEGRMQVDIPIPLDIVNRLGSNKGQSIQLILDSAINCDVNFRTTVVVRPQSQLYLPHDLVDPPVDLRALPAPFFQNSFNRDTALIVVPNQPSAGELQAALAVAAGFGRMTYNRLLIALAPAAQVSPEVLADTNVIFVGKAQGFKALEGVALPAPVVDGQYNTPDADPTDGIVQSAISPWNKRKVVMVVGGNEDAGVENAARAFSTGALQVGNNPALSIVSAVQMLVPVFNATDVNRTFADLGYESAVVGEVGLNTLRYSFEIPPSYLLGPDAYLDLNFAHTTLLEYQRSTIVVKLNDQPIGSVRLSDQTMGQGNAKILLPASAARPGSNVLGLDINLEPQNQCVNPLLDGLWMRVDSSSALHLPLIPNPAGAAIVMDLGKYPSPFAFDAKMNDLAFVLAEDDPVGWNVAAQLAFALGNINQIQIAGLEAFYASSTPEAARQGRNFIMVGKPSRMPILAELYDALPAPFEPGSDLAVEKNLQVAYHLAPGSDVGYLELFPAPWNSKQTILYVGGSSDLGLKWAGAVLQFGRLRGKLNGNLAFINGEQVVTADTRVVQGLQGALATAIPATTQIPVELTPVIVERPAWIIPAIYASLGGIALVLFILAVQWIWRRARKGRQ